MRQTARAEEVFHREEFLSDHSRAARLRRSFLKKVLICGAGFLLLVLCPAFAADFTLPRMEMSSRGWIKDGDFTVSSVLLADLALTGGYKYAFLLGFSLEAPDIAKAFMYRNFSVELIDTGGTGVSDNEYNTLAERINNQAVLSFRAAKATVRDIFSLPLELSYFFGADDNFCNGDDFSSRFGISPVGTDFRGFFYFPQGIGGNPARRYNGIHSVHGTGFSFALTKWEHLIPIFYIYVNFPFSAGLTNSTAFFGESGDNLYSTDLRLLFHYNWLRLEAFGGITLSSTMATSIRGGLMAHIAGNGAEFLVQAGIPGCTVGEEFSIDNIYFLIEPRLRSGFFGMTLTFFYHPVEYLHVVTEDEKGKANINIKFLFGNLDSGFSGGIETGGELKVHGLEDFEFYIAPLATFYSSGLRWDAKIRIRPSYYSDPEKIFDFFIGVRTAF